MPAPPDDLSHVEANDQVPPSDTCERTHRKGDPLGRQWEAPLRRPDMETPQRRDGPQDSAVTGAEPGRWAIAHRTAPEGGRAEEVRSVYKRNPIGDLEEEKLERMNISVALLGRRQLKIADGMIM